MRRRSPSYAALSPAEFQLSFEAESDYFLPLAVADGIKFAHDLLASRYEINNPYNLRLEGSMLKSPVLVWNQQPAVHFHAGRNRPFPVAYEGNPPAAYIIGNRDESDIARQVYGDLEIGRYAKKMPALYLCNPFGIRLADLDQLNDIIAEANDMRVEIMLDTVIGYVINRQLVP